MHYAADSECRFPGEIVNLSEFLAKHGLATDPFAQWNAEKEELLAEYFVPPPYFSSVRGDSKQPKSTIVFAPRGGGKTAQRRVLEDDSKKPDSRYMCVLYDRFPRPGMTVDEHLEQICLRITLGILRTMEEESFNGFALDKADRDHLLRESSLLNDLDAEQFQTIVASLKSDSRVVGDWVRSHSGPVKGVVSALLAKRGIKLDPTQPWGPQMVEARELPPFQRLERLIELCQRLIFESVYVLIDKLDETDATGTDPKKAIGLILPLLLDLSVMELPGLAIKVFVWDLSRDHFHEEGGRRDRIKQHSLIWETAALAEMMSKRLSAFSGGKIENLNTFVSPGAWFDFHRLASYIAHGSPRDMIRFVSHVLSEHLDRIDADGYFSEDDVWRGVTKFSEEVADEHAHKFMPDLLRLSSLRFTQSLVANNYLKIKRQAVGPKVAEWRKTGMVEKIAEVPDSRARPQHLYGVSDPRLAVALRPSVTPAEVLEFFCFVCDHCSRINIADTQEFVCSSCHADLTANLTPSLANIVAN